MKNVRFDLQLFAEGESGCAAEQSDSAAAGEVVSEVARDEQSDCEINGKAKGDTDALKSIGALLGIEAEDSNSLIDLITQRCARASLNERLRTRNAERVYRELLSEAEKLSSKIKGFDIGKELADRHFSGMLRAGFSLEEAWRAKHTEDLIKEAADSARREALADLMEKIQMNSMRPDENGGKRAPSQSHTSVENLTGRGIRDILHRVEKGAKIKF